MRPNKRVLLYCGDERELSVMSFVLKQQKYSVRACKSIADVSAQIAKVFDVGLILHAVQADENQVGLSFGTWFQEMPLMGVVLSKWNLAKIEYPAACRLIAPSTREVLDSLKILMARKRGPKPVKATA